MDRKTIAAVLAVTCLASAQYQQSWTTHDPVGSTELTYVLGVANTDTDPQPELIYRSTCPGDDNLFYIFALDLQTGEQEEVTEEFHTICVDPGREPRLVDVDGDNTYEILFLGQEDNGEEPYWYLYNHNPTGGVAGTPPSGDRLRLEPVRPNPLQRRAEIEFNIPKAGRVSLEVYNAAGERIRTLAQGEFAAGRYAAGWQRDDNQGRTAPAGTYFYVLNSEGTELTRKAVVIK